MELKFYTCEVFLVLFFDYFTTGNLLLGEKIKKLLLLLLKELMIYIYDLYLVLFFGQFTNPLLWEKIIVVILLLWNSSFTHVKCSLSCFSAISLPVTLYHGKKNKKIVIIVICCITF